MKLSAAYLQKQQEWKEEGRQIGLQEGREEVTIALLNAGIDLEMIARVTGISIEELKKLRSN